MMVLKIILLVLLIVIAVLIAIVVLLLIIPFKYDFKFDYKNEERLELKLKYIIIRITGFFAYSPEIDFELKLWNKALLKKGKDSDEEDDEDNSIADTDFIENKDLENDVKESKKAIKDLFTSAKNLEAKKKEEMELEEEEVDEVAEDKEEQKKKAFNLIDKFKNFLDNDIVYVLKKIASEIINVLSIFKPKRYNVTVKYSKEDPYTMGMTLAIAAPLYAFMGENLKVVQNGDSEFNEGSINIVGYPRLYKLIPPIIRLYRDKRVRKVVLKKKK